MNSREMWRMLWFLTGLVLFSWDWRIWSGTQTTGTLSWLSLLTLAAGMVAIFGSLAAKEPGSRERFISLMVLGVFLADLTMWSVQQIATAPGYGLDEAAFVQYAAHLWAHGVNPYTVSLAPALTRYHVPPNGWTWQLNGRLALGYAYPALSFEIVQVLMGLGATVEVPVILSLAGWALSITLLYVLLPRSMKLLAIIVGSMALFLNNVVSGPLSGWSLPLLVLAAYRWDRFGKRGLSDGIQSGLMGIAVALNQLAWTIVPFVLIGLVQEHKTRHGTRGSWISAAKYLAGIGVVFFLTNLPFILSRPGAWLHGILRPFLDPLIPQGQGLISLTVLHGWGGGNLFGFTALALGTYGVLALLLWRYYPWFKRWLFWLPALPLFLSTRSFLYYFEALVPVALLGSLSVEPDSHDWVQSSIGMGRLSAVLAGGLALIGGFVLSGKGPLALSVQKVQWAGPLGGVERLSVRVTNHSRHPVQPHFFTVAEGTLSAPWVVSSGPLTLSPRQTAEYRLSTREAGTMPSVRRAFSVLCATASPDSVSVSSAQAPISWTIHATVHGLTQNGVALVGHPVTIVVQLLNRWNLPVRQPGIPIRVSQTYYTDQGTQFSQAIINGGAEGQSPVSKITNSRGQALFVVRDNVTRPSPVFFTISATIGHELIMAANPIGIVFSK